jgi:hypothetical protein
MEEEENAASDNDAEAWLDVGEPDEEGWFELGDVVDSDDEDDGEGEGDGEWEWLAVGTVSDEEENESDFEAVLSSYESKADAKVSD